MFYLGIANGANVGPELRLNQLKQKFQILKKNTLSYVQKCMYSIRSSGSQSFNLVKNEAQNLFFRLFPKLVAKWQSSRCTPGSGFNREQGCQKRFGTEIEKKNY